MKMPYTVAQRREFHQTKRDRELLMALWGRLGEAPHSLGRKAEKRRNKVYLMLKKLDAKMEELLNEFIEKL